MKKIFFINYLLYRPELPNVNDKYELLSDSYHGDMVAICPSESNNTMLGNFHFHAIRRIQTKIINHIIFIYSVLYYGLQSNRKKKIDIIIAYDPLICGLSGYILKILTKAKFVVEVNGDIINAGFLNNLHWLQKIKKSIIRKVTQFILHRADKIKYVNSILIKKYSSFTKNNNSSAFANFVPTYLFKEDQRCFNKFILFVGFPFYLKGVDILIKAFKKVSHKHKDFSLKIIGHCPNRAPYYKLIGNNKKISIKKAVYFDEIIVEFKKCYCFVLPSRTEGIPRVLTESFSSGKAAIGSNVGGIPLLIKDSQNGFLFEKENVSDLAAKLDILLGDEALAKKMGDNALKYVENNLSASIYIAKFKNFLDLLS